MRRHLILDIKCFKITYIYVYIHIAIEILEIINTLVTSSVMTVS